MSQTMQMLEVEYLIYKTLQNRYSEDLNNSVSVNRDGSATIFTLPVQDDEHYCTVTVSLNKHKFCPTCHKNVDKEREFEYMNERLVCDKCKAKEPAVEIPYPKKEIPYPKKPEVDVINP